MKTQHVLQGKDLRLYSGEKIVCTLFAAYHSLFKTGVINSIMHIDLGCSDVTISWETYTEQQFTVLEPGKFTIKALEDSVSSKASFLVCRWQVWGLFSCNRKCKLLGAGVINWKTDHWSHGWWLHPHGWCWWLLVSIRILGSRNMETIIAAGSSCEKGNPSGTEGRKALSQVFGDIGNSSYSHYRVPTSRPSI